MDYKIVYQGGSAEIVEKKSRFIADVFPVSSEEEALRQLEKVRKQYWDARHHCWASVTGEGQVRERCSDDGEPAGTAGKPILEVIRGERLCNVLVVVTRYFGGTLLGAGGLVRAYTQAARRGIEESVAARRVRGYKLEIDTDYPGLGKIQYLLAQRGITPTETAYTQQASLCVLVPEEQEAEIVRAVTEATSGQADIRRAKECCFVQVEGRTVIL